MSKVTSADRKRSKAAADLKAWSAEAGKRATLAAIWLTDEEVNRLVHKFR